jgi:hypothetical protein
VGLSPSTSRRERRRRRAARRRWIVTVPTVLVVLIAIAFVGSRLRSDHSAEPAVRTRPAPAAPARAVPSLLLAHRAADGRLDLVTVVGVNSGGHDASVLLVPTLTSTETPSFDPQLVTDLGNLGPPSLLQTTIANLLGVRIDQTAVLDDAQLADALGPSGTFTVDLRDPVRIDGNPPRRFEAGPQQVTAQDAATLLAARGGGTELDHLVTVQAVFEGWLRALHDPQVAAASTGRLPALQTLTAAARASTQFSVLPVDGLAAGSGERYQVRGDALGPAMHDQFPDLLLGIDGRRPRVEILNGTGVVGLTQQMAAVVVPAGGNVIETGNVPGFNQPVTRVVYYRDAERPVAEALQRAIGTGEVLREANDIKVFDVTVIAGADFTPPPGT